MSQLTELTLAQAAELLRTKKASSIELTEACLHRIEQLNPKLNAFVTITGDTALAQARAADKEGKLRGPLHGIPIALKDLVDTAGVRTTAASELFRERMPTTDAEIVRRLKLAGAVVLGKLNLHEFAYGGSGVISCFGPARNPRDPRHITGGSSSGSASAIGSGMCFGAVGTDTAGSIRLPAACCGIVGFKPTYGRVSAAGVIPLSESYDHVGPMTRTVEDAALMLDTMCGSRFSDKLGTPDLRGTRIGVPRAFFFEDLDPEVAASVEEALRTMVRAGTTLQEVRMAVDTDRTVASYESWRFHRGYVAKSPSKYHPETLRRIRSGEKVTPAEYEQKRLELAQMRMHAGESFRDIDVIVTSTSPVPAPSFAELEEHPDRLRPRELLMLRNTRPFNVLGLPTISLPCGTTTAGLPVGLQIAAAPGRDDLVLQVAREYERIRD